MIFEKLNIAQYFDAVLTADDVKNGKLNPEIFLNAARKLSLPPEQSIIMEDATNGVSAAKTGTMLCIAITSTHPREKLAEANLIIDSYAELHIKEFIEEQTKLRAKPSS
jgi:beta-phosphoglucomutase-like phosphatase (HAD superfamily)